MPPLTARYAHTNIIARDWRRLVHFYVGVFGCEPFGPERDQSGDWLTAATGVADAHLTGRHLLLPGHGSAGPTLEIYSYEHRVDQSAPVANRTGYGHLAFQVEDVEMALDVVLAHGGRRLGEPSGTFVPGVGELRVVYVHDPELNIVELQSWTTRAHAEPGREGA